MPRRPVSLVLLVTAALTAAGGALAALPPVPPPPVTVPTVTLPLPPPPPLPVPLPPPPAATVPPKVEAPPPSPPPPSQPTEPPVSAPAAAPPGDASSSPGYPNQPRKPAPKRATRTRSAPERPARVVEAPPPRSAPRARAVEGVSANAPFRVQGRPPESAGFFGPIGSAFNALDIREAVVPAALFALAALAILLLTLAAAPLPARSSKTGAMLVHMRGSIALAGTGALLLAVTTYLLL